MHLILVPGLWLDGSAWDRVTPPLEASGHHPVPLTLPGMESRDADRSGVSAQDVIDAIVAEIDRVPADEQVGVVGHSVGAALAWAAAAARPDRVSRLVLVGGFPGMSGKPVAGFFEPQDGELPMPSLDDFEEEELRGLDEAMQADLAANAIPSPGRLATDPVVLADDRRYDVPTTVISTEFTSATLHEWIEAGEEPVQEFRRLRNAEYVDLDTGHWPMFSAPEELAKLIDRAVTRG